MDQDDFDREVLERAVEHKKQLKDATTDDFQIIKVDMGSGEVRWAASLHGCKDIAWFARKDDAIRFVQKCWPKPPCPACTKGEFPHRNCILR